MLQRYLTDCVELALGNWDEADLLNEMKNSHQIVQSVVQCSMDFTTAFSELFPFARSSEAASVCQELPEFKKPAEQLNLVNVSGNLDDKFGKWHNFDEQHSIYEEESVKIQKQMGTNMMHTRMTKQMSMQGRFSSQKLLSSGKQWQLSRTLSDSRAMKIGTARYQIGSSGNQKDDGPPVQNLIAFFEKNN
eukprot:TRINITY_DN2974_c0_g2_i1.p3 TRINITY_DN2974_c0_g2~~TRINITY_DN2974_c0_g2_i1.p3  ORF type:complete len:190 (-),score=20.10 TRINITY_DN2974_c0_g2_i1:745-1314(-)